MSEAIITDSELNKHFALKKEEIAFYGERGYIKLKNVFTSDELAHYGEVITKQVIRLNEQDKPLEDRDTYGKAFLQVMNLWTKSDVIKQFVFGKRLAGIAAELMEVDGVRLYHDQALYKEGGGGYTPWHADQYYWPLETPKTITAWIPLQKTTLEMGALEFSAGSHTLDLGRDLAISDNSESIIDAALSSSDFEHVVEPYDLGEVSFHSGWAYHRASPNTTDSARRVMCIIYMDEDMRLKKPSNEHQQADWDAWCPGARIGEIVDTPQNPVLFP